MTNGLRKHVEPQAEQEQQAEKVPVGKAKENRDPQVKDKEMTSNPE
ncbi:hypothetical protein [Gimesia maris]